MGFSAGRAEIGGGGREKVRIGRSGVENAVGMRNGRTLEAG